MQELGRILDLQNLAQIEIAQAKKLRESLLGKFPLTKPFVEKRAHAILDGATVLVAGAAVVTDQLREKAEKAKKV